MLSSLDMFSIGIGPSSSHTVGPMRAARAFVEALKRNGLFERTARLHATLYGSLALTGRGHGTDRAVFAGLEGNEPETVDPAYVTTGLDEASVTGRIRLGGVRELAFTRTDIEFNLKKPLPLHPNGMRFRAYDAEGTVIAEQVMYSIGGGFIATQEEMERKIASESALASSASANGTDTAETAETVDTADTTDTAAASASIDVAASNETMGPSGHPYPYPFTTGTELVDICEEEQLSVAQVMWLNEISQRSAQEVRSGLLSIWKAMQECVRNGCLATDSMLPGVLRVRRRAPGIYQRLSGDHGGVFADADESSARLQTLRTRPGCLIQAEEWVDLFALAVNEENASGGHIVTAPTNGAAGIIPAVLHYYWSFVKDASEQGIIDFLLTASAVGYLFKRNGSISGAEVGCQGEVGSACSMAAAGMCAVWGGSPRQVENAAEIGIEHNLGLTCDPVEGLVQIPCIERNAIASNTAINAARVALLGDGHHIVSLDQAIATMKQTGADMMAKYKETSRGGLAVTVRVVEC